MIQNDNSYDIFISYRREGGETMAILLHDRLKAKGYNVFLDVESLNSGKFNEQLLTVIENCKDVIVVLAKDSLDRCVNEDDWVRKELAHAFKHRKNIIPFMLRGFEWGVNLPDDISELPLQNGVNANSNEYFDASIERLITRFLISKPHKKITPPVIMAAALIPLIAVGLIVFLLNNNGQEPYDDNPPNTTTTAPPIGTSTPAGITEWVPPQDIEEVVDNDYSERVINQTISAGSHGIAAVKADGTVFAYGMDNDLSGWKDIVSVAVGVDHVLGLKSDGTVVAMGDNNFGQCSVASWKDVIAIHAGHFFSLGIQKNGTVLSSGLLFDYNTGILELRDVIMVASGLHHVAALKADGTVVVFGRGSRGEDLTSGWNDIVAIAADDFFTFGLKSDGSVVWAGENIWEHDWEEYYEEPSPDWCEDIRNWRNIKYITVGGGAIGGDIIGVRENGTVVVSYGRGSSGKEVISEWRDIVAVAINNSNIVGLKSDGTAVYTLWSRWDDITELDEWSGISISEGGRTDG